MLNLKRPNVFHQSGDHWRRVLAAWCFVAGALHAGVGYAADPLDGRYRVNPGDTLTVSVWQEEALQGEVIVRPDGYFSFPLAGEIQAAGQSVGEIEQAVSAKLKQYVPDAVVSVSVTELSGFKVYVIGQVHNPGEFAVNTNIDVMQALAMAEGATEFADLNGIQILRREGGSQRAIRFNYKDVVRGSNLEQNVTLEAGDVVVVP
jgi:polysaccharide export outer membrane protein